MKEAKDLQRNVDDKDYDCMQEIENMDCFHGSLVDADLKNVLKSHGDYVLRTKLSGDGKTKQVMVTLLWNNKFHNINLISERYTRKSVLYSLDTHTKQTSLNDLIKKHKSCGIQINNKARTEFLLINPISNRSWDIKRSNVELDKKLGEGAFGEVYTGILKIIDKTVKVAVKVIKNGCDSKKAATELQQEGSLMRKFSHENVVHAFGMVIEKDIIMLVMELITGGGLDGYLKKNQTSSELKASFAFDIACGLSYLHKLNLIHRDIACRNCLLDLGKKTVKVSDFGLTKRMNMYRIQDGDKLPIRWMAPEVIEKKEYTKWADVYSYAITVWEIFSNGEVPYATMTHAQIKIGIQTDAFRPDIPIETPPAVAKIMKKCWAGNAETRMPLETVMKNLAKYKKCDESVKKNGDPSASSRKSKQNSGVSSSKKNHRGKKSMNTGKSRKDT